MVLIKKKRTNMQNKDGSYRTDPWVHSIGFWCLNPAVVFNEIAAESRSVILTSGTLSPLNSFSSELGVSFEHRFEGNHVIDSSQIWVGAIGTGPNERSLSTTYKSTDTFEYQDQLGLAIMKIVQHVPDGVLVFLPSYNLLEKLFKRWSQTGFLNELRKIKDVYQGLLFIFLTFRLIQYRVLIT